MLFDKGHVICYEKGEQDMSKRLGLALGSGGGRGACHLGVLTALVENDIPISCITGSSMGAVIGGAFASGVDVQEMKRLLFRFSLLNLADVNLFFLNKTGMLRGDRSIRYMEQCIKTEKAADTKIPFACVAVDMEDGSVQTLKDGRLLDNIRASMSIPFVFEPMEINGRKLIDGGVLCRVPVQQCRELGAEVVFAVDALGPLRKEPAGKTVQTLLRMIDIMDCANSRRDLEICAPDLLLSPEMGSISQYDLKSVKPAYQAGYEQTLPLIPQLKSLLQD